ncbi:hypothetical protein FRB93_003260 [Tulasnella sp. JGI-2019a]|nr:hypothetical protein FRB93_003260 [Tulasnella sp. JGI-2019a]
MIGALVTLRNPLPIPVMERLLGLLEGDGGRALHHFHSIISIPQSPVECPRIHHASFPDFITDPLRCIETDFYIPLRTFEARLAVRCLRLTLFSMETRLSRQELDYASRWWLDHWSKAVFEESNPMDLVEAFTSRCLVWWFEAVDPSAHFKVVNVCLTESGSETMLRRTRRLVARVAAFALNAGQTNKAIEALQHVHDTSAVRLRQYRTALDTLFATSPQIASKFLDLSLQLVRFINLNFADSTDSRQIAVGSDSVDRYHNLSKLWNEVLGQIRELPTFTAFLAPISYELLSRAAKCP